MWAFSNIERRRLERLAPWADLELIREKLPDYIKETDADLWLDFESEIEAFHSGETPTLPYRHRLIGIFYMLIQEIIGDEILIRNDIYLTEGIDKIKNYFFERYFWIHYPDENSED